MLLNLLIAIFNTTYERIQRLREEEEAPTPPASPTGGTQDAEVHDRIQEVRSFCAEELTQRSDVGGCDAGIGDNADSREQVSGHARSVPARTAVACVRVTPLLPCVR